MDKQKALEALRNEDTACCLASKGEGIRSYVFGAGDPDADVVFVGEAPGWDEDQRGEPFVGRSGKLLDSLIGSIGLKREDVYITNVVKFRPLRDPKDPHKPGNDRPPRKGEIAACLPVLERQLEIIMPRVICALGNTPARALLRTDKGINALRGTVGTHNGIPVVPTFHPAAVLRNPLLMDKIREDFMKVKEYSEREENVICVRL